MQLVQRTEVERHAGNVTQDMDITIDIESRMPCRQMPLTILRKHDGSGSDRGCEQYARDEVY